MRRSLALLCIALFASSAFAAEVTEEEDVLVLTDDNFDTELIKHQFILVEFYAPWCGHCKKLAPELSAAARTLKDNTPAVPIAKVDATVQTKLGQRFKVQGYPTLKFFANGIDVDFTGGRTSADIVTWIQKRTGETTTSLADSEAVKAFIDSAEVTLVYFAESENDDEYRVFKTVAMGFDDIKFGWTSDENARTSHGAQNRQVVLFKKFDERRNDFSGVVNADNIKTFIDEHSFATVMPFNDRAIEKVFQKQNPTLFLFSNSNEASLEAETVFARVA
jgi:protein disulfide-isomerase A1